MSNYIDLDKLLQLTQFRLAEQNLALFQDKIVCKEPQVKLAIAKDEAFSFYYKDNLEILCSLGVELIPFSPIHDTKLPAEIGGIYLGGGFPEVFAESLANNKLMHQAFTEAHALGIPILAEGGGMIYLCNQLVQGSAAYDFVGLIPKRVVMKEKLVSMGYREIVFIEDTILGTRGQAMRGHEFHYSQLVDFFGRKQFALQISGSSSRSLGRGGYKENNLLATFIHCHFASNVEAAANFVEHAYQYKNLGGSNYVKK